MKKIPVKRMPWDEFQKLHDFYGSDIVYNDIPSACGKYLFRGVHMGTVIAIGGPGGVGEPVTEISRPWLGDDQFMFKVENLKEMDGYELFTQMKIVLVDRQTGKVVMEYAD